MAGPWVSLFSGGKDSSWALHRALERDHPVETLLTVHPPEGAFLFHVPATRLAGLAAESIGLPLREVESEVEVAAGADSAAQGDRELEPLEAELRRYREAEGALGGVIAGAVASEYQASRIGDMCDRLGCELFAPLWGVDPLSAGREMVDAGFEIHVIQVAADGLDGSWLGRQLDHGALDELATLNDDRGVHVLGEGGEYETLVVDGPHMARRLEYDATPQWDGIRGELRFEDAWLAPD
ncbi:MAG: diphthine--ammonia ligase [Halobacteriales archaeon]|nr:diphthine--ammonia ligase [Halobacteriales archaeon]